MIWLDLLHHVRRTANDLSVDRSLLPGVVQPKVALWRPLFLLGVKRVKISGKIVEVYVLPWIEGTQLLRITIEDLLDIFERPTLLLIV